MSKPLFDEKTFFGVTVNTRLFWVIFTLLMVFFTSPLAHLPYFLGFSELVCVAIGLVALLFNLLIPLWIAHRSWVKQNSGTEETVVEFPGPS